MEKHIKSCGVFICSIYICIRLHGLLFWVGQRDGNTPHDACYHVHTLRLYLFDGTEDTGEEKMRGDVDDKVIYYAHQEVEAHHLVGLVEGALVEKV